MPEAPDLEIVQEVLERRVLGQRVTAARVLRPTVLRSSGVDFAGDIVGRTFQGFRRRGKFLQAELSGGRVLLVNPMLTGLFQLCPAGERVQKKSCLVMGLEDGTELRYLDDRQMGMVWYLTGAEGLDSIPRLVEQGPDVLEVSLDQVREGLKPFRGEIKGVLTRGALVAGIGNAYADEILFAAAISPFRKVRALTDDDLGRLHAAMGAVVRDAVVVLRERMGDTLHVKVRDFLKVHGRGGKPCPTCGGSISQLTANGRITSYCRRCQPGMLLKN
jgi:formamidopyrimidine-DNA glycosylase